MILRDINDRIIQKKIKLVGSVFFFLRKCISDEDEDSCIIMPNLEAGARAISIL